MYEEELVAFRNACESRPALMKYISNMGSGCMSCILRFNLSCLPFSSYFILNELLLNGMISKCWLKTNISFFLTSFSRDHSLLTKSYFLSDNRITAEQLTTISSSHRVSQVKRLSEILVSGYV